MVGLVFLRVDGVSFTFHHSIKTIFLVCFVFHHPDGTVRVMDSVLSLHFVSNTFFLLFVYVVMFRVVNGILELVMGFGLQQLIFLHKLITDWKHLRSSRCLCRRDGVFHVGLPRKLPLEHTKRKPVKKKIKVATN